MRRQDGGGVCKVAAMVRAKIEARPLPRPRGERIEKRRLKQTVFVMAAFGPGIGEKHDDRAENDAGRQGGEKIMRLGMKKLEIGQLGPIALAGGARDPLADEIDPDAPFAGMRRRVGREKMSVAAADLTHQARDGRQHARQRRAQVGTALRDEREMGGTV